MQNTKPHGPHAALLASPGMGHLIPILKLGKHLVTLHGFEVTIFIVATHPSTTKSQLLEKTPNSYESYPLHILLLPYKDITSLLDPSGLCKHSSTYSCNHA
jgi:coniferyl-alcohol glucosyltransferase